MRCASQVRKQVGETSDSMVEPLRFPRRHGVLRESATSTKIQTDRMIGFLYVDFVSLHYFPRHNCEKVASMTSVVVMVPRIFPMLSDARRTCSEKMS